MSEMYDEDQPWHLTQEPEVQPSYEELADHIEALEAENARLANELRWYGNRDNWQRHAGAAKMLCLAVQDSGKRARAALQNKGGA